MQNRPRRDTKLAALSLVIALTVFLVPAILRSAVIATALAILVIAAMPRNTRGLTLAAMAALAWGPTVIMSFAFSIFQQPITQEFGWTQTQYATALTIGAVIVIVTSPFAGRLFDRFNVRTFAIASTVVLGLFLFCLYWLPSSLLWFYVLFGIMQLVGAGISSVAFSRVIGQWFSEFRGQAFGTAVAGVGIGGAIASAWTQYMIEWVGWRAAFASLGLVSLFVVAPILFVWLHDKPESKGLAQDGRPLGSESEGVRSAPNSATPKAPALGYTARESRTQPVFWKMALVFFVMSLGTGGVMLQLFPILTSNGVPADEAVVAQGALGIALILGPPMAGYLMDRMFAPYVAAIFAIFPMVGTTMLAMGATGWQATFATMTIGMVVGAEVNFIAYLIPRYLGTRAYAENFGWIYAFFATGSGFAPLLTSLSADVFHSHAPALYFFVGTFAVASILLSRLGPYHAGMESLQEIPQT
jgi:MFS family permease